MKYLILILVVAAIWWLVRNGQRPSPRGTVEPPAAPPREPARQEEMLSCAQCGVHLPRSEALPGRGGVFCGEPHRAAFEQSNAPR